MRGQNLSETACNSEWGPDPGARIEVLAEQKVVVVWRVGCRRGTISAVRLDGAHPREAETVELRTLLSNI